MIAGYLLSYLSLIQFSLEGRLFDGHLWVFTFFSILTIFRNTSLKFLEKFNYMKQMGPLQGITSNDHVRNQTLRKTGTHPVVLNKKEIPLQKRRRYNHIIIFLPTFRVHMHNTTVPTQLAQSSELSRRARKPSKLK